MILEGCNLIPHNGLPVYVYEDCYRAMLEQVLSSHRLFFVAEAVSEAGVGIAGGRPGRFASSIAVVGMVRACLRNEDGSSNVFLQGLRRIRILGFEPDAVYPLARISPFVTDLGNEQENLARRRKIELRVEELNATRDGSLRDLFEGLQGTGSVEAWTDMAGARILRPGEEQRAFLRMESLQERLRFLASRVERLGSV